MVTPTGRARDALVIGSVALLALIVHWDVYVAREVTFTHDTLRAYAYFAYFADALHNWELPLWNPYVDSGEPFFLNAEVKQLWEPSNLIVIFVARLLSLTLFDAYQYGAFIYYLIFIAGLWFLFKRLASSQAGAYLAFVAISLSIMNLTYLRQIGFLSFIYLTPWLILFLLKIIEDNKAAYLPCVAFIMGLQASTHYSLYNMTFVVMLFLALFATRALTISGLKNFISRPLVSALSFAVFAFMAIRALPLYLYRDKIVTTVLNEVGHEARTWWGDILDLFTPYFIQKMPDGGDIALSESYMYIGLLPLLLAFYGALFSRHRMRLALLVTLCGLLSLMAGDRFFFYPILRDYVPMYGLIRNTHIFTPFFVFTLGTLACLGALELAGALAGDGKAFFLRRLWLLFAAIAAIGALSIYVFEKYFENFRVVSSFAFEPGTMLSAINLFFFAATIAAVVLLIKNRGLSLAFKTCAIAIMVIVDLAGFNVFMYPGLVKKTDLSAVPRYATGYSFSEARRLMLDPPKEFGFVWPSVVKVHTAVQPKLFYGSHFFETKDFYSFKNSSLPEGLKTVFAGVDAPVLRLAPYAINVKALPTSGKMEKATAKGFVLLEDNAYGGPLLKEYIEGVAPDVGSINVTGYGPNSLDARIDARTESFLYWSDGFDDGWKAYIDGKEERIYKANIAFKAVVVPKGAHSVNFVYRPAMYVWGLYAYFAGLGVFFLYCVYAFAIRRRLCPN